ncbi:hypothetical protein EXIGLDRAFT_693893 [Exidia glandulosa HHB12029]|uniref:Uncharacterized protein n=1 Tax=Exidia glandulosa HHB12029 TaxID=1314781 RepID=A0A165GZW3_EXIGL|nr:hypothetical protein EXIGLDRAFT_693893 [Exidia glandulosa HHB12029]
MSSSARRRPTGNNSSRRNNSRAAADPREQSPHRQQGGERQPQPRRTSPECNNNEGPGSGSGDGNGEGDDDDDDGNFGLPRRFKKVTKSLLDTGLIAQGRIYCRFIDAVRPPVYAMEEMLWRLSEAADHTTPSEYDEKRTRDWKNWERLSARIPRLSSLIDKADEEHELPVIYASLNYGCSQARSESVGSLKRSGALMQWIEDLCPAEFRDDSALPSRVDKSVLGYTNRMTAFLLCPTSENIRLPGVLENLQKNVTNKSAVPYFIYEDFKYDEEDPDKGLCRSKIVLWGVQHVFTGPSTVGRRGGAGRTSNKDSNADIAHVHEVTPESVAFVVMIIRFLLSTSKSMRLKDTSEFDYPKLYDQLVEYFQHDLDAPASEERPGKDTLDWLTQQVYGNSLDVTDDDLCINNVVARARALRALARPTPTSAPTPSASA